MEKTEKAYKEIFEVLNRYKDIVDIDVEGLETKSKCHLFGIELKEKYGFNIDPKIIRSTRYQQLMSNVHIGFYDGKKCYVSWSDDGSQPKNETLLCFGYSTGAYIFGDDYPKDFFEKFFLELKTYKPKYIDSANKCLYFSMDNACKIFNKYESILKKYHAENKEDIKKRKIKKMKEDLLKLETSDN